MRGGPTVLVVDGDHDSRALSGLLLRTGLPEARVVEVGATGELAERLASGDATVAVVGERFGGEDGVEIVAAVRRARPDCRIVLMVDSRTTSADLLDLPGDRSLPTCPGGWLRLARVVGELAAPSPASAGDGEIRHELEALRRSNADLEQFASVVSHDLQEPLHLVNRYAGLVAERLAGRLETNEQRLVEHLRRSAESMQAMVDDALEYSRIATKGRPFEEVELARAVGDALANLRASIEESGGSVDVGELPTVMGDRPQLVQLFQNLIGNAIKFSGGEPAEVRVSAARDGDAWTISIADSGIGIPSEHRERIFGMFQRLHTAAEVPGTGIGLAICKRIVERHGGTLWVDSTPGEGSTFGFRLPAGPRSAGPDGVDGGHS